MLFDFSVDILFLLKADKLIDIFCINIKSLNLIIKS